MEEPFSGQTGEETLLEKSKQIDETLKRNK